MDAEQGEDAAVANAGNWLRLVFHTLACNNPACVLGERCIGGKQLLAHVLACDNPGACTVASCTSVRRLTLHWLRCQDAGCRLCAGVWRDLSGSYESSGHSHQAETYPHGPSYNSAPPEAPGTPDRFGLPAQDVTDRSSSTIQQRADAGTSAGEWPRDASLASAASDIIADRSVIQLQEATSYMRYLLHGLMCRHLREAPSRAPGLHFWLSVLLPLPSEQLPGGEAEAAGAAAGPHMGAAAGLLAPRPAGRRLMTHRLTCRNPFCALCTGTCELFTRGNGLQHSLPVPAGLGDMDQIVEALSLALGSVNL